jgi:hypothetical protein
LFLLGNNSELCHFDVKELRDGLPERVVALHARPQEIWLTPIFFMLVTVGGFMVLLTKDYAKTKEWKP